MEILSQRPLLFISSFVLTGIAVSCAREPIERLCPNLNDRQLVITEIKGPQENADSYGQWIEVFNASDQAFALSGLVIRMTNAGRQEVRQFMVRDPELVLEPGEYAVFADEGTDASTFLDYSYTSEVLLELEDGAIKRKSIDPIHQNGIIEIFSCGQLVDQLFYTAKSLPSAGTLILDGSQNPAQISNDEILNGCWCNDVYEPNGPSDPDFPAAVGIRGTPGAANRSCGDEGTLLFTETPSSCSS